MISSASSSVPSEVRPISILKSTSLTSILAKISIKASLMRRASGAISARSSRVHTPSATRSSSFTNGSCRSSFFRKYSSTGSLSSMPSSTPRREQKWPAAVLRSTISSGNIVTFLTSWEVSPTRATRWLSMPRFLSRSKISVVMRLFSLPLPAKSSFFSPSPAVAEFLYSTQRTSGSSVAYSCLALPS